MLYKLTVNKRLDEWVTEEKMELAKLEPPKKIEIPPPTTGGQQKTPLKAVNGSSKPCSRANTPEREAVSVVIDFNISFPRVWKKYMFIPETSHAKILA